jgi:hypothetical protein
MSSNKTYICVSQNSGNPLSPEEIVFCDVSRKNIFQENLVDPPHRVHALLLAVQLAAPQEVRSGKQVRKTLEKFEKFENNPENFEKVRLMFEKSLKVQ